MVSAVWDEDDEAEEEDMNVALLCCGSRRRRISCMIIGTSYILPQTFKASVQKRIESNRKFKIVNAYNT